MILHPRFFFFFFLEGGGGGGSLSSEFPVPLEAYNKLYNNKQNVTCCMKTEPSDSLIMSLKKRK